MRLVKPLADLSLELGDWRGTDRPIENEQWRYGDEHVRREYRHTNRRQAVNLWMVYSREGADRGHHPEVCMAVAGQPEDPTARQAIPVEGHPVPVQQYRFGRSGNFQLVFYWHYTLPPAQDDRVDGIQRLYQRLRRRPASVTIEAFAPDNLDDDAEFARQFVCLVDAAMQGHFGPTAVRGSRRQPVTVVDGT